MLKRQSPDWNAFGILQKRYLKSAEIFYIEVTEYAMDKCLAAISRKVTGPRLAKNLLRDGRRAARWVNKFTNFTEELHLSDAIAAKDPDEDLLVHQKYLPILSSFLYGLLKREKEIMVLSLKGISYQNPFLKKYTKANPRTFRYVLTAIRNRIKSNPPLKKAFYLAFNHWGYTPDDFISLINN
jgi:hypothetical protein